jgi:hypothetical protein
MIKISIQYGFLFGREGRKGCRVKAEQTENNSSCDSCFAAPKSREKLLEILEFNINQCILGLYGEIETIPYPPIYKE